MTAPQNHRFQPNRWVIKLLPLTATVVMATTLVSAEPSVQSSDPLGYRSPTRSKPVSYAVDFRVAVTPPAKTKKLQIWLPLPPSDEIQRISNSKIETFPRNVTPSKHTESTYGNRFAYFEFENPDGAQLITHQFEVQNHQVNWNVDYSKVNDSQLSKPELDLYLKHDPRALENVDLEKAITEIQTQTSSTEGGESVSSPRTRSLLGAMNWVDANLIYDHSLASLSASPVHALKHGRGHCSDYHGLCSTLARKVGYPSSVCYGLQMFDKASPSHCKLEVYLPPYGWVPYDLSETQKLVKKIMSNESLSQQEREQKLAAVKNRSFSGFRENTWIEMTRGVHYELVPAASNPVNVVRTIYAEADGVPLEEPDPSDPNKKAFSWMTIHKVDTIRGTAKRFQDIPDAN